MNGKLQITFRNNLPPAHILPVDTTIMGAGMAASLVRAGCQVTGFDLRRAALGSGRRGARGRGCGHRRGDRRISAVKITTAKEGP